MGETWKQELGRKYKKIAKEGSASDLSRANTIILNAISGLDAILRK